MATSRKTAVKVRKDLEDLGSNVRELSKKLVGDVTNTTLDAAEKALAAAQKHLARVRQQLKKPTA